MHKQTHYVRDYKIIFATELDRLSVRQNIAYLVYPVSWENAVQLENFSALIYLFNIKSYTEYKQKHKKDKMTPNESTH